MWQKYLKFDIMYMGDYMSTEIRASIKGESIDDCYNATIFYMNNNKVIVTADFDINGCSIVRHDFGECDLNFQRIVLNSLYEIIGKTAGFDFNTLNSIDMDGNRITNATNYIKEHNIPYELYKQHRR